LQLTVGRLEHRRLFGRDAEGCWIPECAYRPRGPWMPLAAAPVREERRGIGEHLRDAGFGYFFADAHMAHAGAPADMYGELFDTRRTEVRTESATEAMSSEHSVNELLTSDDSSEATSPYRAYAISSDAGDGAVVALLRDPRSSMRVWSRGSGYPGDGAYLEFHKIGWPEGLRLWRVTDRDGALGDKAPYDPLLARFRARAHAADFSALLGEVAMQEQAAQDAVIVAPFDTELFGHWWCEGVDFLGDLFECLTTSGRVRAVTAAAHVGACDSRASATLVPGSWGCDGDFSMWLNPQTEWMWPILWELEEKFWALAPVALAEPLLHAILAQCARSLLLAQSSDWPFIITTGDAADYGRTRFEGHVTDTRSLLAALTDGVSGGDLSEGIAFAEVLYQRDALFPDIVTAIAAALAPTPAP
jgi:1,4-alpha-glucan branching enzyme